MGLEVVRSLNSPGKNSCPTKLKRRVRHSMKSAKNLLLTALTLAATTAGVWAQTSSAAPAPKKKHRVAEKSASPAVTAAHCQALKHPLAPHQHQTHHPT